MSLWIQPHLDDIDAELAELGLPPDTDHRAYLSARAALIAGSIDVIDLCAEVRRLDRLATAELFATEIAARRARFRHRVTRRARAIRSRRRTARP
jgi:hypothetical protein